MKFLATVSLFMLVMGQAYADNSYKVTYSKSDANSAQVIIATGPEGESQAAVLVNGEQNQQFIDELLKDKSSKLAMLKAQIEMDNCETTSTDSETYIDGCGEVRITPAVVTSFGRGGWASAGAGYTFFVGFVEAGSGRFFEATYMVKMSEGVEAIGGENDEFDGTFLKSLTLDEIKKL